MVPIGICRTLFRPQLREVQPTPPAEEREEETQTQEEKTETRQEEALQEQTSSDLPVRG